MTRYIFLLVAGAALAAALPLSSNKHHNHNHHHGSRIGELTYYTEGLGDHATACGQIRERDEYIVALGEYDYGYFADPNDNPLCGSMIRIYGRHGKHADVEVADRCSACQSGDVDVPPAVFKALGYKLVEGRVSVSWDWLEKLGDGDYDEDHEDDGHHDYPGELEDEEDEDFDEDFDDYENLDDEEEQYDDEKADVHEDEENGENGDEDEEDHDQDDQDNAEDEWIVEG